MKYGSKEELIAEAKRRGLVPGCTHMGSLNVGDAKGNPFRVSPHAQYRTTKRVHGLALTLGGYFIYRPKYSEQTDLWAKVVEHAPDYSPEISYDVW